MSAEKYRGIKFMGGAAAVGMLLTPSLIHAESALASPPRPTASTQDNDTQNNSKGIQFDKYGTERFSGSILVDLVKKVDPLKRAPEPTPPPVAFERPQLEIDKNDPVKAPIKQPEAVKKAEIFGKPTRLGYYRLYESTNEAWKFIDPKCTPEHWGSKELVRNIHAVADKWKKKYPEGHLRIGDLNGPEWEHASHKRGIDFDLNATTNGKDWVGNMKNGNYNQKATIELGKIIADTGKVKFVFFNDPVVRKEVDKYKRWGTGSRMQPWPNHDDHFHVRLNIPQLPRWAPQGENKHCSVDSSND